MSEAKNIEKTKILNRMGLSTALSLIYANIMGSYELREAPTNAIMYGAPGVGKTSILSTKLCKDLSKSMGREVVLVDIRLSAEEAATIQGIPFVNDKDIVYGTPEWFRRVTDDTEKYFILFFGEITNANKSVQHAAYRILQERSIQNGGVLPWNVAIIADGNLREHNTGAMPLLPAVNNRFGLHLHIDTDLVKEDFINYAIEKRFDASIITYITNNPAKLNQTPGHEEAWASSRSWEAVNKHLKNKYMPKDQMLTAIAAAIGSATALDFDMHRKYHDILPQWDRIRSGEKYTYDVKNKDPIMTCIFGITGAIQLIEVIHSTAETEINNLAGFMAQYFNDEVLTIMFKSMKRDIPAFSKIVKYTSINALFDRVKPHLRDA